MNTRKIFGCGIAVVLALTFAACPTGNNNGGNSSNPLAGEWYRKIDTSILAFEITSAGKFIYGDTTYDIAVSGSTATITFGGTSVGTFGYAISNDEMVIINGTGIGMAIATLSPVVLQTNAVLDTVTIGSAPQVYFQSANDGDTLDVVLGASYTGGREAYLTESDVQAEVSFTLMANSNKAAVAFALITGITDTPTFVPAAATGGTSVGTFADGKILLVRVTSKNGATTLYYRVNIAIGSNATL